MNTKPTFRQQYDKIVGAYLRNQLSPSDNCACFIGNLLNGRSTWAAARRYHDHPEDWRSTTTQWSVDDLLVDQSEECVKEQSSGLYNLLEIYNLESIFI